MSPSLRSSHAFTSGSMFLRAKAGDDAGVDGIILEDLHRIKARIKQLSSTPPVAASEVAEEPIAESSENNRVTMLPKKLLRPARKLVDLKKVGLFDRRKPKEIKRAKHVEHPLVRSQSNPILSPNSYSYWESQGTFNPAVFEDKDGTVHLLYRAVGNDGVSRFGYAASIDGVHFDDRYLYPVYEPLPSHDPLSLIPEDKKVYSLRMYPSGGSWGGYEDPRAVVIEDRVYLTYVAFGGWGSIRMALTSIDLEDFKNRHWEWKKPLYISPENETHKNWVIFPEKINGKFAILHGIVPEVYVEYVDSLTQPFMIHSPRPVGPQPGRKGYWDNKIRGVGTPPIKTAIGWLLLYHAIDQLEPSRYKLGAMILDLNDPTKILYRSPEPILNPDMHYENDGKPGVVYASGALVRDGNLYVYYGGGDKYVCVARTNLDSLLRWLVEHGNVTS